MAPVVLFETHSLSYIEASQWTGFWTDILNAIRHHPPRTPTRRINKIEPLISDLIGPSPPPTAGLSPPSPPQPDLLGSKFQVEYVSFPRLVDDEAISKDEDTVTYPHDELKKVMFQQHEQLSTTTTTSNSLGGSRRRLLGTPWMF